MSNLNVPALKRLFPKNTTRKPGGKVSGANRKRVQVMLPPDTLARLDELIEHDEQARSAAVALGVEVLCALADPGWDGTDGEVAAKLGLTLYQPGRSRLRYHLDRLRILTGDQPT